MFRFTSDEVEQWNFIVYDYNYDFDYDYDYDIVWDINNVDVVSDGRTKSMGALMMRNYWNDQWEACLLKYSNHCAADVKQQN